MYHKIYDVISAVESVLKVCPKKAVIVIESTISPKTIDKFIRSVIEENGLKDIDSVWCIFRMNCPPVTVKQITLHGVIAQWIQHFLTGSKKVFGLYNVFQII